MILKEKILSVTLFYMNLIRILVPARRTGKYSFVKTKKQLVKAYWIANTAFEQTSTFKSLQPCNFIKKIFQQRCFSVKFAKFLLILIHFLIIPFANFQCFYYLVWLSQKLLLYITRCKVKNYFLLTSKKLTVTFEMALILIRLGFSKVIFSGEGSSIWPPSYFKKNQSNFNKTLYNC